MFGTFFRLEEPVVSKFEKCEPNRHNLMKHEDIQEQFRNHTQIYHELQDAGTPLSMSTVKHENQRREDADHEKSVRAKTDIIQKWLELTVV